MGRRANAVSMDSVITLQTAIQNGDYSLYDISPKELGSTCIPLIDYVVTEYRQSNKTQNKTYYSEYYLNKQAIHCAFGEGAANSCNYFSLILNRLTLIDNMYATQMRMRPYGIGELADAISLFGPDSHFKSLLNDFLVDHDIDHFDYLKANIKFYRDGQRPTQSNLFAEGYGTESHRASNKRAWSLITKYAYFLTVYSFPIYDSVVIEMIPIMWKLFLFSIPLPNYKQSIVDYIVVIDKLRSALGGLSYDELDFLLWSVGK